MNDSIINGGGNSDSGNSADYREAASNLKSFLLRNIRAMKDIPLDELLDLRYQKYRKIGVFLESVNPDDPVPDHPQNGNLQQV